MEVTEQRLQSLLRTVEDRERTARKRAIIYSIVPILLAGALIWFTSDRIIQTRLELSEIDGKLKIKRDELKQTEDELKQTEDELKQTEDELKRTEDKKKDFETALLDIYGWTHDKISNPNLDTGIVDQSLQANIELDKLSSSTARERRSNITIQYFPKDFDQKKVTDALHNLGFDALHNLGFRLDKKKPLVKDVPTNSIWFGEKVELDDVKLVAYLLTRAGVQIRAIESFKVPTGRKASLIQVGASTLVLNEPVFTVEKIRTLTFEQLRGKSRTYGGQ